jgi:predicted DNA-binding transcriptional regulator AlpA
MLDNEILLDDRAVARLTGRARPTLQKDRFYGRGLPFVKIGRMVRYRRADVEAWLAALPAHRSTAEYDRAHNRAGFAAQKAAPVRSTSDARKERNCLLREGVTLDGETGR